MSSALIQLTDLHVQVGPGDADAAARVERAIELVRRIDIDVAGVLVTGDLANDSRTDAHERAAELLGPLLELGHPVLPLVGNHDDRQALRDTLGALDGIIELGSERHLQYAWQDGSWRVLALDTQHTGRDDGKLCDTRHEWLCAQLAAAPDTPTVLAMHHPPVPLGLPAFDAIGLRADHAERLHEVVIANEQIELVVCGHVHRPATSRLGHAPVFACPSVFYPARPDLVAGRAIALVDGPVGIGVHVRTASGSIASHVRVIGDVPGEQHVITPHV